MRSLLLAALAFGHIAAAGAAPTRAEIAWEITRNGTAIADAEDVLVHDGRTYTITSRWKGRGLLALGGEALRTSRGEIVSGSLRPREFVDARSGRDSARASFDWDSRILTQQYKESPRSEPIPVNAHDRLTQLYGFAFRAAIGDPVQMNVASGRGVSAYSFRVAGRESLMTPAGEFETVRLSKIKDGPEDRSTDIWLAVKRHHLPVRVLVIEKDGTRVDQKATRVAVP